MILCCLKDSPGQFTVLDSEEWQMLISTLSRQLCWGRLTNNSTRLGAAHYFSRTAKNFEKFESIIVNSATTDSSAEVRMASTLALGKIVTDSSLSAISRILKNEDDYRVRVSAVRALRPFAFKKIQPELIQALGRFEYQCGHRCIGANGICY